MSRSDVLAWLRAGGWTDCADAIEAGQRLEPVCRKCGKGLEYHCDLDEPGVDHKETCGYYHHEFKP